MGGKVNVGEKGMNLPWLFLEEEMNGESWLFLGNP